MQSQNGTKETCTLAGSHGCNPKKLLSHGTDAARSACTAPWNSSTSCNQVTAKDHYHRSCWLQVVPASGTVLPMGKHVVAVEFLSQSLQVYNEHQLALDIMTVGEGLQNIPIKAECVVPMVTPNVDLLDFEQCYLR